MADDGLGGTTDHIDVGGDDGEHPESRFVPVPNDEDEPGDDALGWVGDDDELRSYAEKKGYSDPAMALKQAREAEKRMREMESRAQALEQQVAQTEGYIEKLMNEMGSGQPKQPQGPSADGGDPRQALFGQFAAISQAYQNGQIDEAGMGVAQAEALQAFVEANNGQMEERFKGLLNEHVVPLQDRWAHQEVNETAKEMHQQFPDEEIGRRAVEIIRETGRPSTGQAIKEAYLQAAGERYARQQQEARAQNRSETLTGGGGRGARRGVSAEDAILQAIMGAGPRIDDGI